MESATNKSRKFLASLYRTSIAAVVFAVVLVGVTVLGWKMQAPEASSEARVDKANKVRLVSFTATPVSKTATPLVEKISFLDDVADRALFHDDDDDCDDDGFALKGAGSLDDDDDCDADLKCGEPPPPDLDVDNLNPQTGDVATFSALFSNDGPDPAKNVVVTATYDPNNFECPSPNDCNATGGDSQDDNTPGTITFTINELQAGGGNAVGISFQLQVKVGASGSSRVDATVTASDATDPDSTPGSLTLPIPEDDECTVAFSNLPVELVLFEAQVDGRSTTLRWETASETNNAGFEIQHRYLDPANKSASSFEALAWVEGHGTTLLPQAYRFEAGGLDPGRHVFRLKQIDFDGTFEFSPEVEVAVEMPEAFLLSSIYPNPFNPQASFSVGVRHEQAVAVEVYNLLGQRVMEVYRGMLPAGLTRTLTIEGSSLVSGTYILRVTGKTFVESQSFTVIK